MRLRTWRAACTSFALVVASSVLFVSSVAQGAQSSGPPHTDKLLLFSSDGMRPDLMNKYVGQGQMPTYASLIAKGVQGDNGMVQAFPPNTGVGWYTMATGTYPSEHGSTNNTFFRSGDAFTNRTSFSSSGVLQADTLAAAAERAGKKVAQVEWTGGINAGIRGPTVDFATFYSKDAVLVGQSNPTEAAGAAAFSFGITYRVGSWVPASGWSDVPVGDPAAPPMEISGGWPIASTSASNPARMATSTPTTASSAAARITTT
jgi:type I phosphodiesterase/nucleotide pyrophosphatase